MSIFTIFDNLFGESDVQDVELSTQQEVETLSQEDYTYFLAHGSLDTDREVY